MICCLNPILNGAKNLCMVSQTMNQNKTRLDPPDAVKEYMKAMESNMQEVINAIRTINDDVELLIFADALVEHFNTKYTLKLS